MPLKASRMVTAHSPAAAARQAARASGPKQTTRTRSMLSSPARKRSISLSASRHARTRGKPYAPVLNEGKRDRERASLDCGLETGPVGGDQEPVLPPPPAVPDGSNGVNYPRSPESMAACYPGLPGRTPPQSPTLLQEPRPRCTLNGAVDASPAEQRRVGGVDDRVDLAGRYVALNYLDPGIHLGPPSESCLR